MEEEINSSKEPEMEEDVDPSQSTDQRKQPIITKTEEDVDSSQSTDKGKQPIITETEEHGDPSQSTNIRLPCLDLFNGSREEYLRDCVPLFRASITGDWEAARVILDRRSELVGYAINADYDTPLHVAASVGTTHQMEYFVKMLVDRMHKDDHLTLQNKNSNTALWLAAAAGNVNIARTILDKNSALFHIRGGSPERVFPLYVAVVYEKYDMVRYLIGASNFLNKQDSNDWKTIEKGHFLRKCMDRDFFDIAMRVVTAFPDLLLSNCEPILRILAEKPDALYTVKRSIIKRIIQFTGATNEPTEDDSDALKLLKLVWETVVLKKNKTEVERILIGHPHVDQTSNIRRYSSEASLFIAAEAGNTRFLVELFKSYPHLIWKLNNDGHTIFHIAIMRRHQGIYNLLYEVGSLKDQIIYLKDKDDNNLLHLVGKTSKEMRPHMVEASLVMQRELLWFKAVEKILPPILRDGKNKDGQTPYELFSENNKEVVSEGLKWTKHCMVVATLIVTVAFAVAFTVPGGYHQTYGRPFFLKRSTFIVFVIADGICLFSSTASLLMFLSILTSRYNQRHFVYSLPKKLMYALLFLFVSVLAMMVTFSASFFVLYHNGLRWIPFLISGFVAFPVIIFSVLQIPVLMDICRSVYDNRYLFNPRSRMLFPKK